MVKINLSTILGKYRMSQAELARKTGIRPSTICDIYNEMCDRINLEHLDRICEVLECDISDILEYQPNKIKKTGKACYSNSLTAIGTGSALSGGTALRKSHFKSSARCFLFVGNISATICKND